MPRVSKTVTFSLPPEMGAKVEEVQQKEGRTMSELVREALRRYVQEREWQEVLRYGERNALERGMSREDVETLVDEYRSEARKR